jgi:hypothetical protein
MAAASYVFTKQKLAQVVNAGPMIKFDTDTLVCLLVVAGSGIPAYTGSGCAMISDVTGTNAEVTGTGYSRQTLTSVTVAVDGSVNTQIDFSHAAITFAQNAAGFTNARYVVLAKSTGTDSTSPVFLVFDPNETLSAQTGDVVLSSPTGGELQWS